MSKNPKDEKTVTGKSGDKPVVPTYAQAIAAGYKPEDAAKQAGLSAVPAMTPELEAEIATAKAEWAAMEAEDRKAEEQAEASRLAAAAKLADEQAAKDRKATEAAALAARKADGAAPYWIPGVGGINVDGNQVNGKDGVFMLTAAQVAAVIKHGLNPQPVSK